MVRKTTRALSAALVLALTAAPVLADNGNKPPKKATPPGAAAAPARGQGVPPGLAKKPGAMPPGQYKKIYGRGEVLPKGYVWIDDLGRWRLSPPPPGQGYVRYDDEVYRIARDTATVIEAIGIVRDLFN